MNSNGAFERFIKSYQKYYNISTEGVAAPFVAEAEFKSHSEQYFLVKAAKIADIDSNEIVFFYSDEEIPNLNEIASLAWSRGLERVSPYFGHRNSDVTLIVLSEKVTEETFQKAKKLNYYKSYKFGFYGWSSFRLLVCETSTGRVVTNRRGSDLKKLAVQNLAKAG